MAVILNECEESLNFKILQYLILRFFVPQNDTFEKSSLPLISHPPLKHADVLVDGIHIGASEGDDLTHMINRIRNRACLLYTSPSPRDLSTSRMPSSA